MFGEKIIPTGIPEFDSLLGGGLLDDSTLLIVYGTHSFGWALGVEVFKRLISSGGFGIATNYSFPALLLERYSNTVGYDVFKDGLEGKLAIIDVFGSLNELTSSSP
ncbi:hypothetical protein A3K92_09235 [Thermococcus gorgonarius]|uniref:Uncharacterized protein n=2 Tax=Thermococcus gorgonarius TaxID=71997 RepID=A0A2Z2M5X0_THEGO|nr:hypothetical protein A3K92_09235 [Thermococcus gorgonarius]